MNFRFYIFLCIGLLYGGHLAAQGHIHDRGCGVTESHPWMDAYLAGEIATPRSTTPLALPVRYIFIGRDNGTGYADLSDVLGAHCQLNEDFLGTQLSYFIEDMDTINSTFFYEHTFNAGSIMMANNNQSNVINVYLVGEAEGICGYYSGSRDGVVVRNDCLGFGDYTLSHEIGHYHTLRHTFFGWEGEGGSDNDPSYLPTEEEAPTFINGRAVERIDGSNCDFAADGFCDTPPDYISLGWSCTGAGIYADSLLDPDGTKFAVPGRNIMAYSNNNCQDSFSLEQVTAMEINANSRIQLHTDETLNDIVLDETILIAPEDNEVLPVNDFVQLQWEPVADADFYVVQINFNSNFGGNVLRQWVIYNETSLTITEGLLNNRFYFWRVRAGNKHNICPEENYSEIRRFRNGFISSTNDPALDAAVAIFPNPAPAGTPSIRIQASDLPAAGLMSYELADATGRILVSSAPVSVLSSGFQAEVPTQNLVGGIYFLRLRVDGRLLTRRVVVM
ncbi:MAG: zinc-dependent metalloprotease [Bacteroidota bacterium]